MFTLLHYKGAGKQCFDSWHTQKIKTAEKKLVVLAPARHFIVCARRENYRHRHNAVKAVKIYDHISVVSARIVSTICSCEFVLFTNVHLQTELSQPNSKYRIQSGK